MHNMRWKSLLTERKGEKDGGGGNPRILVTYCTVVNTNAVFFTALTHRYCVRYANVRHLSALIASAMQEPRSSVWLRHGW